MFNEIYSIELPSPIQFGRIKVKHLAVKQHLLAPEVLLLTASGKQQRWLLCEVEGELREIIRNIERE